MIKWDNMNESDHGGQEVAREKFFVKWCLSRSWRVESGHPCEGSGEMADRLCLVLGVFHWMSVLHFIPSQTSVSTMLYVQCVVSFYILGGLCCSEICIQQTGPFHVLLKPLLSGNAWAIASLIPIAAFIIITFSFQYLSILVLNCAGYSYCVLSEPAVWLLLTLLNRLRKNRSIKVLLMKKENTHDQS